MILTKSLSKHIYLSQLVLAIIPVLYFLASLIALSNYGCFYQRITDPEYFHLLNGINLALFNLATPYIDHPGTVLQVIVAISSWPVSIGIQGFIADNVVDNPELFLKAAIVLMNIIVTYVLFVVGRMVFSSTKNIWDSLIIQLMPFGNIYALNVFGRLTPESFMIVPILLLSVILIVYLNTNSQKTLTKKQIIYLAMIGGLGMAIKFSYLPFLVIPIFVINSFKRIIKYSLLSISFTLLFAFPILFNLSKSISWFGNMFVKSGHWGDGKSIFIEWAEIPHRLQLLLNLNYLLPILLVLLIVIASYVYFVSRRKRQELRKLNLITVGIISGILLSVFLITKHFAYRYYFPTLLFQVVLIYLIIEYASRLFWNKTSRKYISSIGFGILLLFIVWQLPDLKKKINQIAIDHQQYAERSDIIQNSRNENIPLIISSYYAGCPFPEFSLNNAYLLCGNLKTTFSEKLRNKYPRSIFYVSWSDKFFHWNHFWEAKEFIESEKGAYVFIGQENEKDLDVILARLKKSFPDYSVTNNLVHHFRNPEEYYYKIELVATE
mgnify:CR=1 FL=1|tara:strand:- start:815 stop:2464 length:1650 start_codon:yes stop_codon:yes gene_type:complete